MPPELTLKPEDPEPGDHPARLHISSLCLHHHSPLTCMLDMKVKRSESAGPVRVFVYCLAMPTSAFTKIAPSAVGIMTFQPMFISWSYR